MYVCTSNMSLLYICITITSRICMLSSFHLILPQLFTLNVLRVCREGEKTSKKKNPKSVFQWFVLHKHILGGPE